MRMLRAVMKSNVVLELVFLLLNIPHSVLTRSGMRLMYSTALLYDSLYVRTFCILTASTKNVTAFPSFFSKLYMSNNGCFLKLLLNWPLFLIYYSHITFAQIIEKIYIQYILFQSVIRSFMFIVLAGVICYII